MHRGKFGELYFESLPGYVTPVMIPALDAMTKKGIEKYIEEHFEEKHQKILKEEFEKDYHKLLH